MANTAGHQLKAIVLELMARLNVGQGTVDGKVIDSPAVLALKAGIRKYAGIEIDEVRYFTITFCLCVFPITLGNAFWFLVFC